MKLGALVEQVLQVALACQEILVELVEQETLVGQVRLQNYFRVSTLFYSKGVYFSAKVGCSDIKYTVCCLTL